MTDGSDPRGTRDVAQQGIAGEAEGLPSWARVDWDRLSEATAVRVAAPEKPAISQDLLVLPSQPVFAMPNEGGVTAAEANERAARAEEEAKVLRRELERERRERERLEALLAERRGPRTWRRFTTGG